MLAFAIENSQVFNLSERAVNLDIISDFPHFDFWKKTLWTLFVLHSKERQINFLSTSSFFINLEEWNVDAFNRIYFIMISYYK